jgi:hypothetical protein
MIRNSTFIVGKNKCSLPAGRQEYSMFNAQLSIQAKLSLNIEN